ncbi:hypothetical protein GCM10011324_28270 [Allosediminivita pacifica]|uniref:Uncharacterized protein DUF4396 n=2 Tax=Allosediminivita pacifica TaxID=1267769 RepID=A0A2T6ASC4_9RHOB|nr:uncharacterized protein DUF4396 [Allosediminivita pacifica]GGB16351.1 hypothetical protein GCM10011324_28270 [Allosediminivita pacifica]
MCSAFMQTLTAILSSPWFLIIWAALVIPCQIVLIRDLTRNNTHLMSLMKVVWVLTVLYSGPFGLLVYWRCGRKEIPDDGLWRRAFRSVAHCYSGCGMGEIVGLIIAVGLLQLGNWGTAAITFTLAYVAGYALTVGPLLQGGEKLGTALKDAVISETPSIAVMEVVAIGVDMTLAGEAGLGDIRFWSSLIVSLTCGLIAAYPVNVLLIRKGVKEGMMDPRMTDHAHHH